MHRAVQAMKGVTDSWLYFHSANLWLYFQCSRIAETFFEILSWIGIWSFESTFMQRIVSIRFARLILDRRRMLSRSTHFGILKIRIAFIKNQLIMFLFSFSICLTGVFIVSCSNRYICWKYIAINSKIWRKCSTQKILNILKTIFLRNNKVSIQISLSIMILFRNADHNVLHVVIDDCCS